MRQDLLLIRSVFPLLLSLEKGISAVSGRFDACVSEEACMAARRGVVMQGFWLQISQRGREVLNRTFTTPCLSRYFEQQGLDAQLLMPEMPVWNAAPRRLPHAELHLLPGRYRWQVGGAAIIAVSGLRQPLRYMTSDTYGSVSTIL